MNKTTIALGNQGRVNIWADYLGVDDTGWYHFHVINGNWSGKFLDNQLYVNATGETSTAELLWVGQTPKFMTAYQEAIPWIQSVIDDPSYVMPPFELILEKLKYVCKKSIVQYNDDEIPF